MLQTFSRRRVRALAGFTLIEMVVVLVILAALAGLVIPQIAMLGRSSDMAASAKTQADLASNLQLFFVLQKRYPQGLDSLVDGAGAIYASDTTDATTQTRGLPYAGADGTRMQDQIAVTTLDSTTSAQWYRSFTRSGFDYIFNHSTTAANSNNSGVTRFPTTGNFSSSGTITVAEVTGTALLAKLVPQGLASTDGTAAGRIERVVALGIGPGNAAVSKTITNAPTYPGADGRYYGRYIAFFKIYASGERATLVGVGDSYGRTPDYTQQQFNESLPDGGRQG